MIIILFGAGVVSMTLLFGTGVPGEVVKGVTPNIPLAGDLACIWRLGFGSHQRRASQPSRDAGRGGLPRLPLELCHSFIAAQTAGAFTGAALVFMNYRAAFQQSDPMLEKTAGIFTTFPAFPAQPAAGFIDQVLGTAILLFLVLAVTDNRNTPAPAWFTPVAVGAIVVGIGISYGALHGYAINPARDFGPRMFIILAGFRNNGLTDASGVWWVPVVAPMLGGLIGAGVYDLGIRRSCRAPTIQDS